MIILSRFCYCKLKCLFYPMMLLMLVLFHMRRGVSSPRFYSTDCKRIQTFFTLFGCKFLVSDAIFSFLAEPVAVERFLLVFLLSMRHFQLQFCSVFPECATVVVTRLQGISLCFIHARVGWNCDPSSWLDCYVTCPNFSWWQKQVIFVPCVSQGFPFTVEFASSFFGQS